MNLADYGINLKLMLILIRVSGSVCFVLSLSSSFARAILRWQGYFLVGMILLYQVIGFLLSFGCPMASYVLYWREQVGFTWLVFSSQYGWMLCMSSDKSLLKMHPFLMVGGVEFLVWALTALQLISLPLYLIYFDRHHTGGNCIVWEGPDHTPSSLMSASLFWGASGKPK